MIQPDTRDRGMTARSRSSRPRQISLPTLFLLLLVVLLAYLSRSIRWSEPLPKAPPVAAPGEYLFCVWNVENLFDDINDNLGPDDEEYDDRFADNPEDLRLKLSRLTEALLRLNNGKGPDIFCAVEVESKRAAELLTDALNRSLPAGATPYHTVVMERVTAGRQIAPAVISRLPLNTRYPPRLPNRRQRILVTGLMAGGHELTVYATHWTSRRSDSTGERRASYADLIYGDANRIFTRNPKADIIVCGDFNDSPQDSSVRVNLRTADRETTRLAKELRFFNLLEGKDPQYFGTHFFNKPVIYDQICISPGLLDEEAWTCLTDTLEVIDDGLRDPESRSRRPWSFGKADRPVAKRGYSDHFPVVVRLRVREQAEGN